ncbi:MAG: methyltransferase domain-containing protein [Opitutus sp.]|nr:methyltransferase domain-containing protein [Opitutus sp.]
MPTRTAPRSCFLAVVRRSRLTRFLAIAAVLGFGPAAQAQLGARSTAEWLKTLDAQNRVVKLKVDEVVLALKLKPGSVVADIGAGSGVFTVPLAKAVTAGKVYAVDIEQGLVDHITKKAAEQRLTNVQGVLGKFTDANLPAKDVDLALIFDVLHHIENRTEYLKNLVPYLKKAGRIVVIDFHPELGPHKNDPALQVTKAQAEAWFAAIGFKPVTEHALYTDKWFVEYAR